MVVFDKWCIFLFLEIDQFINHKNMLLYTRPFYLVKWCSISFCWFYWYNVFALITSLHYYFHASLDVKWETSYFYYRYEIITCLDVTGSYPWVVIWNGDFKMSWSYGPQSFWFLCWYSMDRWYDGEWQGYSSFYINKPRAAEHLWLC